jgi:hypothetical protein
MAANLTTKLGQLVDVLTPDTTNTRIGVANASPTRTLDVTGTGGFTGLLTANGGVKVTTTSATTDSFTNIDTNTGGKEWRFGATTVSGGYFAFYNATDAVFGPRFSSTGNVGIGMTPSNVLDITQNQNGGSNVSILNNSATANAYAGYKATDGTTSSYMVHWGASSTGTGINLASSLSIQTTGTNGLRFGVSASTPIVWFQGSSEVARIGTDGSFLVGTTTNAGGGKIACTGISNPGGKLTCSTNTSSNFGYQLDNTGATNPSVTTIQMTGAAPNSNTTYFIYSNDSATERFKVFGNGGIANFSANNVNLSDIRTKPDFVLLDDAELDKLEAAFIAVDWAKYKYNDQTHDDWNYGPSAQGVEKAFATANPTIVDIWNPETLVKTGNDENGNAIQEFVPTPAKDQLKCIYTGDLENISHALLARLLQRMARLEALEK